MSEHKIEIELRQAQDYRMDINLGEGLAPLTVDLPPPLGGSAGPSPEHLLASAVGTCLSASLLFSLRKYKQSPDPLSCKVSIEVGRNADKRVRVLGLTADLRLGVNAGALEHLDRVLAQFEEFCTVTQSVRQGIPVTVRVFDASGTQLK